MGSGFVFQIDGNFGASAALAEMLVQSHSGRAVLLPAIPRQLGSGSLHGLRLRGGSTLDMEWKNGKVTSVRILPDCDQIIELEMNGETAAVELEKGKAYTWTENSFL